MNLFNFPVKRPVTVVMGMLIAVLILLTALERQQELTALKGAGISLYRLMVPALLVAVAGGITLWLLLLYGMIAFRWIGVGSAASPNATPGP